MTFRCLTEKDIDVRVGQVGISAAGDGYVMLLLYKDARVDMDILDESVGSENWQRKHYEVKGNMYCSVGINCSKTEQSEWVWKDDCGTESNTEKEKGEASDAFKRACVNWGIGRELYTAPPICVKCEVEENKGKKIVKNLSKFTVAHIKIDNKVITELTISAYDKNKRSNIEVFKFVKGDYKQNTKAPAPAANTRQSAPNAGATPSVREQQIERLAKGTKYTVETANEWARKKFGKPNMNDITDAQYNELYNALNNAVKKERGNG